MKRFFIVSDEHGEFDGLIKCLNKVGFDENNETHFLISLGDNFDRGEKNLEIYEFYKRLGDKGKFLSTMGNHDMMLIDYLSNGKAAEWNYQKNGLDSTIYSFSGMRYIDVTAQYDSFEDFRKKTVAKINETYPKLLPWLNQKTYFIELGNYILTHGGIDGLAEDWRNPKDFTFYDMKGWEALIWVGPEHLAREIKNTDKRVVVGHIGTNHLRKLLRGVIKDDDDRFGMLHFSDPNISYIDRTSIRTKEVNVFIVDDNFAGGGEYE